MRTLLFFATTCLAACALDPVADTGFEDPSVAEADTGAAYGSCLTRTVTGTGTCPTGRTFYGRYDYGASSGYGLGWCAKNS